MPTRSIALLVVIWLITASCSTSSSLPTGPSEPNPAAVQSYLEDMIGVMQTQAANAAVIDWTQFRSTVLDAARTAQTIPAAYPAIELALRLLNDFESHYLGTNGRPLLGPAPVGGCASSPPQRPSLPETVGYVLVAGCDCDGAEADAYAEALQAAIRAADRPDLAGWIVDLRGNGGGNMWPMIAGVGPVLGDGIIGWIVYNNREYEREYRAGAALSLDEPFSKVKAPYTLTRPAPRVAVLTDRGTVSAGEAITVWFKGRPETRSFGEATCGHHHLLQAFPMRDGGTLVLKTAHNADRLKQNYAGPVMPDEVLNPAEAVLRAISWLQENR